MVRHGETVWNTEKRHQGHLDSPLTKTGQAQGQALAERLAGFNLQAIYSSDLMRALDTARLIDPHRQLPIQSDTRLRERHFGIFQGLTLEEVRLRYPFEYERHQSHDPDYVIPGGESLRQFYRRTTEAFAELVGRQEEGTILAVTHGGVLVNQFKHVLDIPLEAHRRFSMLNTSVNIFSFSNGRWMLETWGDSQHLVDMEALDEL